MFFHKCPVLAHVAKVQRTHKVPYPKRVQISSARELNFAIGCLAHSIGKHLRKPRMTCPYATHSCFAAGVIMPNVFLPLHSLYLNTPYRHNNEQEPWHFIVHQRGDALVVTSIPSKWTSRASEHHASMNMLTHNAKPPPNVHDRHIYKLSSRHAAA